MNTNNTNDHRKIFKIIEGGIEEGQDISFFLPHYKIISQKTTFIASTLLNDWFFRARIATNKLFEHTDELKYPPKEFALKGRLNDQGEQITYLSTGEIAPIAELDLNYYQLFCMIKIKHVIKNTLFYYVGVRGQYETHSNADIEVNNFYLSLLTSKGSKNYNATIALGKHFLESGTLNTNGNPVRVGIIYNSVHEHKSNKLLYNIAIHPEVFDACCKIENAYYYVLTYNPQKNTNIMDDINKGSILNDGTIKWEKSYLEMINKYETKYSNDKFKKSQDSVIHFEYGGGKIVEENNSSYFVAFRNGTKQILKKELLVI